jgi:hypothetical protein
MDLHWISPRIHGWLVGSLADEGPKVGSCVFWIGTESQPGYSPSGKNEQF